MNNTSSNEIIELSLTKKQCNAILEALLFSSSVDICSDWKEKQSKLAINTVKDINKQLKNDINLENIYLFKNEQYHDTITEDIVKELSGFIREEHI